jgi:ribosomal protein L20
MPHSLFFAGNGDVLDIVVHQNIRVSDIFDSDYPPIIFHILDHVKIRNLSERIEKFTDWNRFQSLASELTSPKIEIDLGVEVDKAVRDFTAFSALVYTVANSKVTLSVINNYIPGLDGLLKHKRRLRKLWQETMEPACKTPVN